MIECYETQILLFETEGMCGAGFLRPESEQIGVQDEASVPVAPEIPCLEMRVLFHLIPMEGIARQVVLEAHELRSPNVILSMQNQSDGMQRSRDQSIELGFHSSLHAYSSSVITPFFLSSDYGSSILFVTKQNRIATTGSMNEAHENPRDIATPLPISEYSQEYRYNTKIMSSSLLYQGNYVVDTSLQQKSEIARSVSDSTFQDLSNPYQGVQFPRSLTLFNAQEETQHPDVRRYYEGETHTSLVPGQGSFERPLLLQEDVPFQLLYQPMEHKFAVSSSSQTVLTDYRIYSDVSHVIRAKEQAGSLALHEKEHIAAIPRNDQASLQVLPSHVREYRSEVSSTLNHVLGAQDERGAIERAISLLEKPYQSHVPLKHGVEYYSLVQLHSPVISDKIQTPTVEHLPDLQLPFAFVDRRYGSLPLLPFSILEMQRNEAMSQTSPYAQTEVLLYSLEKEEVVSHVLASEAASVHVLEPKVRMPFKEYHPLVTVSTTLSAPSSLSQRERSTVTTEPSLFSFPTQEWRQQTSCTYTPKITRFSDQSCKVRVGLEDIAQGHEQENTRSRGCSVGAWLEELGEMNDEMNDVEVSWFRIIKTSLTQDLVSNPGEYVLRVKERNTDYARPFYEIPSASYIIQSTTIVALADKILRSQGLVPVWEVDTHIRPNQELRSGQIYLKTVMGVEHEIVDKLGKQHALDYLVRIHDTVTGTTELKSLTEGISLDELVQERYELELIVQARTQAVHNTHAFQERITFGYHAPSLTKLEYDPKVQREEPGQGTYGIDELIPEIGQAYEIFVTQQGRVNHKDPNMKGAYQVIRFTITAEDLAMQGMYTILAKNSYGEEIEYLTQANTLGAILHRKCEEHGIKGVFMTMETRKDTPDRDAQYRGIGSKLNHTTLYLAGIEGMYGEVFKENPYADPSTIGILIHELKQVPVHSYVKEQLPSYFLPSQQREIRYAA